MLEQILEAGHLAEKDMGKGWFMYIKKSEHWEEQQGYTVTLQLGDVPPQAEQFYSSMDDALADREWDWEYPGEWKISGECDCAECYNAR